MTRKELPVFVCVGEHCDRPQSCVFPTRDWRGRGEEKKSVPPALGKGRGGTRRRGYPKDAASVPVAGCNVHVCLLLRDASNEA